MIKSYMVNLSMGDIKKLISDYLTVDEFRVIKKYLGVPISHKINQILSPLKLSTITIGGSFSNISYNEEKNIDILKPKGEVLGVSCNFYEALLKKDGSVDEQFWKANHPYPPFPIEPLMFEDEVNEINDVKMDNNIKPEKKIEKQTITIIITPTVSNKKVEKNIIRKLLSDTEREKERVKVNKIREQYYYQCIIPKKKSNRGRKKQIKKKKKRKTQGSGKCFNSGAQLIIKGEDPNLPNKYYKIKVYRNGSFTIPGGLSEDLSDVVHPLNVVAEFFSTPTNKVKLIEKHIIMQNYKCNVEIKDTVFNIDAIRDIMYDEKKFNESLYKEYGIRVGEITYSIDRHAGLTIKFWRQHQSSINKSKEKRNKNKKTTVKISQKCKINIDGAVEKSEVINIWKWLNKLLLNRYNDVVYDILEPLSDSDSSDTDKTEYEDEFNDIFDDIYENEDSDHNDYENFDYIITNIKKEIIKRSTC